LGALLGSLLLAGAITLLISPPNRERVETTSGALGEPATEQTRKKDIVEPWEPGHVVTALLVGAVALLVYAINGVKILKANAAGMDLDARRQEERRITKAAKAVTRTVRTEWKALPAAQKEKLIAEVADREI
jgi:hypothetical protein